MNVVGKKLIGAASASEAEQDLCSAYLSGGGEHLTPPCSSYIGVERIKTALVATTLTLRVGFGMDVVCLQSSVCLDRS